MPKAVWGFNGTERPGAVYLAAVLAGHNQKGLPAFGIYGRDVQDAGDTRIPADVQEKLLRFARAGLAVADDARQVLPVAWAASRWASPARIVDHAFFEDYLGMRVEMRRHDRVRPPHRREDLRPGRVRARPAPGSRQNCKEGKDYNAAEHAAAAARRRTRNGRWSVKMTMIARDLMVGNPRLAELGFGEEALGHNAIAGGFQGQRQWTDHFPNGDFMEAILNSSFDWNGIRAALSSSPPRTTASTASAMLFGHLLTNTAQIFADVRTYWSPEAVKRVTGHEADRAGAPAASST